MSYGHQAFTLTFLSGASISSAFETIGWSEFSIEAPTYANLGASNTNVYVQVCDTATGTFRDLHDMGTYSATSGIRAWEIPQNGGNYIVPVRPWMGYKYAQVRLGTAATGGINFRIHLHNQTY